jgi:hypothetical protein
VTFLLFKNYTMKRWQKIILGITIFYICFFIIFYILCLNGNSGFEQQYQFNVNKAYLIRAVEDFKTKNKEFIPPSEYKATDSLDTLTTQFTAYIYYPNENSIVCFYIDSKPSEPNNSYINLLSINQGLHEPQYKLVNKDFDRKENLEIKKEFHERFLNKLNLAYKDDGNGNFVFWK